MCILTFICWESRFGTIWEGFQTYTCSRLRWTRNRNRKASVFSIISDVVSESCSISCLCEWLKLNYLKNFLILKSVLPSQILPS